MHWTDLDQAYLEIFGEHPDVDPVREAMSVLGHTFADVPDAQLIVYSPADRPDVEVLYEGVWCPGEVRMVRWPDGVETHQVQYRRPGQLSSRIDNFTAENVRKSSIDYSDRTPGA